MPEYTLRIALCVLDKTTDNVDYIKLYKNN